MAKTKTSKKPKAFSVEDMESVNVKGKPHDPNVRLSDPYFIFEALIECLREGDTKAFKEILRSHYDAVNISKALKASGLSKRTFYGALSPEGNPSLDTVMKMVSGLKQEKAG